MPERKKRFKNINLRVFLVILVLTAGVSVLVKLNKNFNFTVKVPLTFVNLPQDKILKAYSKQEVKVSGRSTGYDYIKYNLTSQDFAIDLSKLKNKSGRRYYYVFSREDDALKGSLSESTVTSFEPDTIFFDLDQNFEKKLPVKSKFDVSFAAGYGSLEGIKISPDSVLVRGPKSNLDSMSQVFTKAERLKDVKKSYNDSIELNASFSNQHIEVIPARVSYKLNVDRFTEGDITVPLQLINVPSNVTAKIFPKRVSLIFNVNFKNYERIKPSDFKVVCDFEHIDSTSTSITPEILEYPEFIRDVRLREKTVQYLLVK